jgi:hypothetical protein
MTDEQLQELMDATIAESTRTAQQAADAVTQDPQRRELVLRDAIAARLASRGHPDAGRVLRAWHGSPSWWH